MATIEFSPAMALRAYRNVFPYQDGPANGGSTGGGAVPSYDSSGFLNTGSSLYNAIYICKGTRPTTLQANLSSFTPDVLVTFTAGTHYSHTTGPITQGLTGTTFWTEVKTTFASASANGLATYFAILTWGGTGSNPIYQQTTGTVGLAGSGADLIISNTTIVSGTLYRVTQLRLEISTIWTY